MSCKTLQHGEVRQVSPDMCPALVVASNTSTRNMLTGCLQAWGADVSAAVDLREAETYLDGNLPAQWTVTAILSLSEFKWQGTRASHQCPLQLQLPAGFVPMQLGVSPCVAKRTTRWDTGWAGANMTIWGGSTLNGTTT
jgi:hypothetical protein